MAPTPSKSKKKRASVPKRAKAVKDTPPLATAIINRVVSRLQPKGAPTFAVNAADFKDEKNVVSRLLTENPWEKAALAEIYVHDVIGKKRPGHKCWLSTWKSEDGTTTQEVEKASPSVFIESGSTCIYISEVLRTFVDDNKLKFGKFDLGTNNDITAWLFLNDVASQSGDQDAGLVPYLFAGRLEVKYHGTFPFYRKMEEHNRGEEREGYAHLRLSLAKSDLLLLATSRLSLRYGPLVGSRENALFKNACYNAFVPPIDGKHEKEIHLFITIHKLVTHPAPDADKHVPATDDGAYTTWSDESQKIHDNKCFAAFDIPADESPAKPLQKPDPRRQSPFSQDLLPDTSQLLRDGTLAAEMGDGRIRICQTWEELFTKAKLTVKVFVAFGGSADDADPCFRRITNEVTKAQEYFEQTRDAKVEVKLPRKVGEWTPEGSKQQFSLVEIQILPTSNSK